MQIEWTTHLITLMVVLGITSVVFGFLLAALIQGRKATRLEAELEQQRRMLDDKVTACNALHNEHQLAMSKVHVYAIEQGKLEQQLLASQATTDRLMQEARQQQDNYGVLENKYQSVNEQLRVVEKQHEAAQTTLYANIEQIKELRARQEKADGALQTAAEEIKRLNTALSDEGKKAEGYAKSNEETGKHFAELKGSVQQQKSAYEALQQSNQELGKEHAQLKTTLEKREEHFKEQMQQLADTKQSLTKEFENLANKIFEEKGKTFSQTSQTSIDSMLKPFREQIEGFQKRVNDVHDESLKGNTSLNSEIKKVLDIGMQMSKEANNLTSALKGDSQQRGAWGEAQLRRTLEMSGLIEDTHFEVQSAFKDADGKNKQTDYLVKLPDGKHIIIDSKVTLIAYDRAVSAETPEEHNLAMHEHIKAVRKHIDDLASKDYTNLVGMRSPSFVLMFMPIEPAYIEALKNNKDLFEYGYKKNIVLVSHTTLIPILRTVSNLWMMAQSNAEAQEISEKAGEIYNQVCLVAERLSKLGGTLNTASNHYNNTVKALAGQQGLYGKVERFNQLSTKVSKTLPALDPAHMDFENERLTLIVEAIDEETTEHAIPALDDSVPGLLNQQQAVESI